MTVDESRLTAARRAPDEPAPQGPPRLRHPRLWLAGGAVLVALLVWLAFQLETGASEDEDVYNPQAPDPLPEFEWLGVSVKNVWQPVFYGLTIGASILLLVVFWRHWKKTGGRHPGVVLFVILFIGLFFDPIFNWAMYVPYDPALLHWPTDWPLIKSVPTVEPLWILVGAYQAFFLAPALALNAAYRRWFAGQAANRSFVGGDEARIAAWISRHPVWSLAISGFVVGVVFDIFAELWMMNIGIYYYSQIPGPYMTWGSGHLGLLEIKWSALQIALLAVLLHRDDRGRSMSARIAGSVAMFRRLKIGEFGAAFLVLVAFYSAYAGCFAALRLEGWATHTPGGWKDPYYASKVYDPQGELRDAGIPGPYRSGTWCHGSRCDDE